MPTTTKDIAKISSKNLHADVFSLEPSSLIVMYEIDISDILFDMGIIAVLNSENENQRIFRFHNSIKLINNEIWWQDKMYVGCPIQAEGFEYNARGTIPVPKLTISSSAEGIPILSTLKSQIESIGDLIGAKVTRKKTLLKFLDQKNSFGGLPTPPNTSPDPYAHFPDDIYYVERKSFENSNTIQYELSSILDLENVQLPHRLVLNSKCVWNYRGEGCLYECRSRQENELHGTNATLPITAPPIANEKNELLEDILKQKDNIPSPTIREASNPKWNSTTNYLAGDYIYVEKTKLKYYFVCRQDHTNKPPPDTRYWIPDSCSKTIEGCKLRWGLLPDGTQSAGLLPQNRVHDGCLPFGGFPGTNKVEAGNISYLK